MVQEPTVLAICGKNRIAVSALAHAAHLLAARQSATKLVAVPNPDDSGADGWQPSFKRAAQRLGIPVAEMASLYDTPGLVLISLEYSRIIRVAKFASQRLFNIHFSALPAYRGVFTSIWPILNGESQSGVTLHFIDPGIDTGAIVAQRVFPLPGYVTSRQLYEMYLNEGFELFCSTVSSLLDGVPAATPQDESRASYYSRQSLDLSQREIDLDRPAADVSRFVRAFAFPEYQLPTLRGRRVRNCRVLDARTDRTAGTVILETAHSTAYAVRDGGVVELEWETAAPA